MTVVADTIDEFASDPEMVAMFVNNANELLEQIETDLVAIEKVAESDRVSVVNRIFRSAHTIKGESGFVGLNTIGKLAHTMENLLDQVRESKVEPTSQVVSTLLSSLDVLRSLLQNVEESNQADISGALEPLVALTQDSAVPPPTIDAAPAEERSVAPQAVDVVPVAVAQPIVEVPAPVPTPVPVVAAPSTATTQTRTRVLVVDDEPIVRSLVVRQMSKLGVQVDQAESAEMAQQMMRKGLYHVVICDLNLPGISGVELVPRLKSISPLVQVIMLTGDANLVTVLESLENGAIDFIPKTRDYSLLEGPVRDALARVDRWTPLMRSRR